MIRLKNIKQKNNIIECDIIPENSLESGYIQVDVTSESIIQFKLPKEYEWCRNHVEHAKNTLIEMSKNNTLVSEKLLMWN
jgi:hypothetical protein